MALEEIPHINMDEKLKSRYLGEFIFYKEVSGCFD